MIEETAARMRPLVGPDAVFAVVGEAHAELTRSLLDPFGARVIAEPFGRNTAACIGLAALHVARRDPAAPMFVLPADHFIANVAEFLELLGAAAEAARSGAIVTLGVLPTRPETGYGYIETGDEQPPVCGRHTHRVARFVEKPDVATAVGYLSSGRYLWNSGIFVFTPETILREIRACHPSLSRGLDAIDQAIGTDDEAATTRRVYEPLESISIDYAVMERTKAPILVFKSDFGWSDVGSWQALYELRENEWTSDGNLFVGDATAIDARRCLVYSTTNRFVGLLGVEDLVVADTPDAVLIARLDRSQDVKKFPDLLKQRGTCDLM